MQLSFIQIIFAIFYIPYLIIKDIINSSKGMRVKQNTAVKQDTKQNNRKKLILTSVLSFVFIGLTMNAKNALFLLPLSVFIIIMVFIKKYTQNLQKEKQIEKSEKEKFDKSIVLAKQYVNKKNLDKALSIYQGLLKENPTSKDIEDKLSNLNNDINKAEQLFIQSMGYFENGDIDETEKYIKLVTNIYKKQNYITLETDILKYKQCVAENEQNNYENAYTLVNELVVSYPNNSHLILLSQKITENLVKYLYEQNKQKISNGKFDSATKSIERMLTIEPENETYKNLLYIAQNRLVDISTCGKGAILTLEGFDEEKAKRFIKDREIMTWYDIESFAKYFNLQPHEQVLISDRLIFPLKPHIKQGRTIDM